MLVFQGAHQCGESKRKKDDKYHQGHICTTILSWAEILAYLLTPPVYTINGFEFIKGKENIVHKTVIFRQQT